MRCSKRTWLNLTSKICAEFRVAFIVAYLTKLDIITKQTLWCGSVMCSKTLTPNPEISKALKRKMWRLWRP